MKWLRWIAKVLLCHHEYEFYENIYGDQINLAGGKRSLWRCRKCGWMKAKRELVVNNDTSTSNGLGDSASHESA